MQKTITRINIYILSFFPHWVYRLRTPWLPLTRNLANLAPRSKTVSCCNFLKMKEFSNVKKKSLLCLTERILVSKYVWTRRKVSTNQLIHLWFKIFNLLKWLWPIWVCIPWWKMMYLLQSNICLSIATSLLQSLVTLEMDAGPEMFYTNILWTWID